jgi:hypothetical protein
MNNAQKVLNSILKSNTSLWMTINRIKAKAKTDLEKIFAII